MTLSLRARTISTALAVCGLLFLSGCNQYWERSDTTAFSAGDAVAHNAAVQIADPWPRASRNTTIPTNGERAYNVFQRYKDGTVPLPSPTSSHSSASGSPNGGSGAAKPSS